jgi:hypothetical protein
MPDLVQIVNDLASIFERLYLQFALGGALATNYWGVVRTTQDVNCLVALPAIQYQSLADELHTAGCVQRNEAGDMIDVSAIRMRNQAQERKLIECFRDSVRIELFVPVVPLQNEILRRVVRIPFGGRDIPITTAEDLILLKLAFHRAKDLQDVRGMLWVQRGKLDLDYMREWSTRSLAPDVQHELEALISQYSSHK